MGIADAGATGHFLQPGAPAINIKRTKHPISISQPDGGKLVSTHECEINNPKLPKGARKAHIVPGLAHTSPVSVKMWIYAGCFVTYGENVIVYYNEKVVWKGPRENLTGLWVLPLKNNIQMPTHLAKGSKTMQRSTCIRCHRMKKSSNTSTNAYSAPLSQPFSRLSETTNYQRG